MIGEEDGKWRPGEATGSCLPVSRLAVLDSHEEVAVSPGLPGR